MSFCPFCGLAPTITTEQDEDDNQLWYMCENDHTWKATDETNPPPDPYP